jgi:hypothetical protein
VLESDHQPLKWILTNSKLTGKLARWALMLNEYDFEVKHRAGVDNAMDCLSRYPQVSDEDCTEVRQEGELDGVAAPIWSASACLSKQPTQPKGTAVAVVEARALVNVWADATLLAVFRGSGYTPGSSAAEKNRLQHRAKGYEWREDHLVRRLVSGEARVVPRPAARGSLVKDVHERAGHLGVKKTLSLLRPHYWWVEMAADVARTLKGCEACDRVKAVTFNARHPTLQPLPIKGLFYRWGLDFAGPLSKTRRGNQYVFVMVEHFSKTVVLVPTRDKKPATVVEAFTREVLTRYGAPAEVVTDRGGEFGGAFQDSCLDAALVDHRATSSEDSFPKSLDPNGPERDAALRLGSRSEPQAADWVNIRYRVLFYGTVRDPYGAKTFTIIMPSAGHPFESLAESLPDLVDHPV